MDTRDAGEKTSMANDKMESKQDKLRMKLRNREQILINSMIEHLSLPEPSYTP